MEETEETEETMDQIEPHTPNIRRMTSSGALPLHMYQSRRFTEDVEGVQTTVIEAPQNIEEENERRARDAVERNRVKFAPAELTEYHDDDHGGDAQGDLESQPQPRLQRPTKHAEVVLEEPLLVAPPSRHHSHAQYNSEGIDDNDKKDSKERHPILIVPGFMSSGLAVEESKQKPAWEGKRIWINLQSLGFSSLYFGSASKIDRRKPVNTIQPEFARLANLRPSIVRPPLLPDADSDGEEETENQTEMGDEEDGKGGMMDSTSGLQMPDDQMPTINVGPEKNRETSAMASAAAKNRRFKSDWLEHMLLSPKDLKSENPGIRVRPIPGLEGVDYLSPGTLTNHVSYVFGPVIDALQAAGWTPEQDLQAAPYDWRLSPTELERRDKYFSRTIDQIEKMYQINGENPIVLLGHSLGCKTAHYLLNFCLQCRGQAWIDTRIHAYMPVGGPHLGAPKAIRSVVAGDKMGLDAFLSDEEAVAMGRTLGSGPWLFPQELPHGVPASVYVRPEGVLEIEVVGTVEVGDLVRRRRQVHTPGKYQLVISIGGDASHKKSQTVVTSSFEKVGEDRTVSFSGNRFFLATPERPTKAWAPEERVIQVLLHEPGLSAAKRERRRKREFNLCCCIFSWLSCACLFRRIYQIVYYLFCGLYQAVVLSADAISSSVGGSTLLAFSELIPLDDKLFKGSHVMVTMPLYHKDDHALMALEIGAKKEKNNCCRRNFCCCYYTCFCWCCCAGTVTRRFVRPRSSNVQLRLTWRPYSPEKSFRYICSPVAKPSIDTNLRLGLRHRKQKEVRYHGFTGYDLLEREGLQPVLRTIRDAYDRDDFGPRDVCSSDPPPIRRVRAIYGVNLPTEVGAVYRRSNACVSNQKLQNLYKIDTMAELPKSSVSIRPSSSPPKYASSPLFGEGNSLREIDPASDADPNGHVVKKGVIMETKKTRQADSGKVISGDGTVPYFSLSHVRKWQSNELRESVCKEVSVVELDRAEHRAILADPRLHESIIEYCSRAQ